MILSLVAKSDHSEVLQSKIRDKEFILEDVIFDSKQQRNPLTTMRAIEIMASFFVFWHFSDFGKNEVPMAREALPRNPSNLLD